MDLLVIGNPVAGGGRAERLIGDLAALLASRGHRYEVFLTRAPGDARKRVLRLAGPCDAIIVAGGDGTLNEVINGIAIPSCTPIAFLPAGTGNVIAHELGLASDPAWVVRALEGRSIRRLDVGRVGDRRFLMLASAGFDALVTEEVHRHRKGTYWLGGYAVPIVRALCRYHPPRLTVTIDGAEPIEGELVIVSKTPYYGGIFTIAHRARCDSGHFDVCVFRTASACAILGYAVAGLRRTLRRAPGIAYVTGRHVEITGRPPTAVQVDGDYFGTTPITLDLEPAALPVFAPQVEGRGPRGMAA